MAVKTDLLVLALAQLLRIVGLSKNEMAVEPCFLFEETNNTFLSNDNSPI